MDELTDDALTGRLRVWQRARGHRYSLDDVLTAWEAARELPTARRYLDLGCGIGSVLLMVTDRLHQPETVVGVEAQELSFGLAQRNVARNGLGDRVRLVHGDLRDPSVQAALGGPFELVTGTPPYMPIGTSTPSPDPQRRYARVEMRGGVEAYLEAAAALVSDEGRVVVCCDARTPQRAIDGAARAGLVPIRRRDATGRVGQAPLFTVWTFARAGRLEVAEPFVARDADGRRSEAYLDVRAFFGLPPTRDRGTSPPKRGESR